MSKKIKVPAAAMRMSRHRDPRFDSLPEVEIEIIESTARPKAAATLSATAGATVPHAADPGTPTATTGQPDPQAKDRK